jgi:cation diffusion facilitator CzcD-associated flavoprotein CzcO
MASGGAGHVTMLQRSPSYIVSRPAEDRFANFLNRTIPLKLAYRFNRWKNIGLSWLLFKRSRAQPGKVRDFILNKARETLGQDYDVATHLTPRYDPWDERLCLIPDNDMFQAMAAGKAAIVTGQIDRFTATGIRLENGTEVPADIIVTATGLRMEIMSGVTLLVDGQIQNLGEHLSYKGFMYSDIPNIISSFGYSNASWTLKSDLIGHYMCRLLKHMDATGTRIATPRPHDVTMTEDAMLNLKSGYVKRALAGLPKQGDREPWKAHHDYFVDRKNLRSGALTDEMVFSRP